jgi:beta-glucosidase
VVHGGGSGSVVPSFISTPLAGISSAVKGQGITYNDGKDTTAAATAAKAADIAIVFVATLSHEGGDRASLSLDDGGPTNNQNALVAAVAAAQPNTIGEPKIPPPHTCLLP